MSDMDWNDQAASVMKSWVEAQKVLWESWAEMSTTASAPTPFSTNLIDQWQKLAQQGIEAWPSMSAPVAKSTAEQFIAAQGIALRFVEFSVRAWEAAAPKLKTGEDWQAALMEALDQMRQQWLQFPSDAVATSKDVNNLWQLYMEQWQSFGKPWEAVLRQAPAAFGQAATGRSGALIEFSNLYRETYNQTVGRLATSPNLGMAREFNQKIQQGFDAFVAWHLANLEYQGVMVEVWDQSFKKFAEDIVALAEKGEKIESVQDLILLWTRGSEQIFTEAFRTEKYVLTQGKLLQASMAYRLCERGIIEEFMNTYDLPTRTELDEAHRRIYELRKEVKALKKAIAEISANMPKVQTAKVSKKRPAVKRTSTAARKTTPEVTP